MQLLWLEQARSDRRKLFQYLLEQNPAAARRTADAIQRQVDALTDQPALGRPGRVPGTRELVIARSPYIVAYTVDRRRDVLIVLRVLHGAQRGPEEMCGRG